MGNLMQDWKQNLYNRYLTSGQSGTNINLNTGLVLDDYQYFSRVIKHHLPQKKDIKILDLACGHGALIYCLKQFGYKNIEGIDISLEQVELAHKLGLKEIKCQNIMGFLVDKSDAFDVIFLMDIIEHLDKKELFSLLDKVFLSLKANGIIVIHCPNGEGIFGMRIRYGDLTHENCFTPQSIRQLLKSCGFYSINCFEDKPIIHGLKSFFRYILWISLTAPVRLLFAAETGIIKQVFSQNMLITARKK